MSKNQWIEDQERSTRNEDRSTMTHEMDDRFGNGLVICILIAAAVVILLVLAATGNPDPTATPAGVLYGQALWLW